MMKSTIKKFSLLIACCLFTLGTIAQERKVKTVKKEATTATKKKKASPSDIKKHSTQVLKKGSKGEAVDAAKAEKSPRAKKSGPQGEVKKHVRQPLPKGSKGDFGPEAKDDKSPRGAAKGERPPELKRYTAGTPKKGSKGKEVEATQRLMNKSDAQAVKAKKSRTTANSDFGSATKKGVADYQKKNKLDSDGKRIPKTITDEMKKKHKAKAKQKKNLSTISHEPAKVKKKQKKGQLRKDQ